MTKFDSLCNLMSNIRCKKNYGIETHDMEVSKKILSIKKFNAFGG